MRNELLMADASMLESAGQDMLTCGSTTQDTLTRMQNQVEGLRGTFQGRAAEAFYAKMEMIFQETRRLIEEMNEMGGDLKVTANRVRTLQAEAENILRD